MSENENKEQSDQNQRANQEVKKDEKDKAWMNERKAKGRHIKKVREFKKQEDNVIKRESTNQVEDLLVRTAFSAIL